MKLQYKKVLHSLGILALIIFYSYLLYKVSKITVINLFGESMFRWIIYYIILIMAFILVLISVPSREQSLKSKILSLSNQMTRWFLFLIFLMIVTTTFFFYHNKLLLYE